MERAVELYCLNFKWGEIARLTNTPYDTLMRWQRTSEWQAMVKEWRAQDPLVRRAKAVIARGLGYDFLKRGRPDTSLAERIIGPRGNGEGAEGGGGIVREYYADLPALTDGLESKGMPPGLLPEPAPPAALSRPDQPKRASGVKKSTPKGGPKRRRVVGPDE